MTFKNDEERREYFRNELRKKLPELKKIEGFPIADDEDIIALSDPPYYTACPNPWINDFIEEWEREKKEKYGRDENEDYHREPFAADVSEGKNDPIYNAHSYHTKVPYKAIMRYILHYTEPGDIVFDGFSGSGMTGVAGAFSGNSEIIKELGYEIDGNDILIDGTIVSKVGKRNVILNDLSPAATFISRNYNYFSSDIYEEGLNILDTVERKYRWMYETYHVVDGEEQRDIEGNMVKGVIRYVVWSDVYVCPNCTQELVYWDVALNLKEGKLTDTFACPYCSSILFKKNLEKAWETVWDKSIQSITNRAKQVPVLINYAVGTQRFNKKPDKYDLELIKKIEATEVTDWFPKDKIPEGYNTSQPIKSHGLTHVHNFYTKRNLIILSAIYSHCKTHELKFLFTGMLTRSSKQARFLAKNYFHGGGGWVGTSLSGTLFVPSLNIEVIPTFTFKNRLEKMINNKNNKNVLISTQATQTMCNIPNNTIDYIFTDPPFGGNLMYSELNFNLESWLKVKTNYKNEAIVNQFQGKQLEEYQILMELCFQEYYRILKPGRWMTVEFSNSQASVWNAIQEAIQKAGFVIANVSALDKKQGSFKAVTTTTAVKQDLVISAYKPKTEHIEKMRREQNTEESAWTFVRQHLEQLPVFIGNKGEAQIIAERTPRILFDRMVAYHVQNGLPVPISSAEFQAKVAQRFPMRDGMVFLESQVAEYDKKRTLVKEFVQMSLFVTDETSAIEWLRQQLLKKPQTRQDLHPNFMKEIQHIAKHEKLPELDDLLEQNFLKYEGDGPVPDQIASYLRRNYKDLRGLENDDPQLKEKAMNRWYVPDPNKQADLEKLREKALLREFEGYVEELSKSKKKLKQFRTEAIRAGFKKAWSEKDYETIVKVGERLPENVIQEDDKLLMYYDNAQIRLGM
ncbi:DNA methyltransferase [Geobacillus sp. E263]|uniref:DNA methyltransferase n=1 Tax=Geobacillus sp. E263 TaxID=391290 RepID=UPI00117B4832|nr:DNA methyltransferase [Geobacillus sp. E263]